MSHSALLILGLHWDILEISVSLPSDTLSQIQQLADSLLQTQSCTICQVIFLFVQDHMVMHNFIDYVMSFNDMLNLYHSPAFLICSFQLCINSTVCLSYNRIQFQSNFLFLTWLSLQILHQITGPFIFRVFGSPLSFSGTWSDSMSMVHIALHELQTVVLMLNRMAFCYLVKLLPYIWKTILQKLFYVIKVVQCLFLFAY